MNTSRTASKTRGLVARLLAVLASIALVFGFVPAASAATGPISGTQATNSTEYYNVLRTNSNAQNIIQFKWNGNNAGGGGLNFMITTNTNVVMGSVTGSYNVWLTMRNSRANTQWFPSGGFYTAATTSGACGQPCNGNGMITWTGNLNWSLPY